MHGFRHLMTFQHTAARRRLGQLYEGIDPGALFQHTAARRRLAVMKTRTATIPFSGFNTQPPEGGWLRQQCHRPIRQRFQHTAARRRLEQWKNYHVILYLFQHTAARRRLENQTLTNILKLMFQHTAARRRLGKISGIFGVVRWVSTHSRPKAAGLDKAGVEYTVRMFQHTAARRRLDD